MPRSGTTLVEQIIASHNDVYGAGELVYIQKLIKEYFLVENELSIEKVKEELEVEENFINKEYFKMMDFHKFKENNLQIRRPKIIDG